MLRRPNESNREIDSLFVSSSRGGVKVHSHRSPLQGRDARMRGWGREIPHSGPWEDPDITTMIGDAIVES